MLCDVLPVLISFHSDLFTPSGLKSSVTVTRTSPARQEAESTFGKLRGSVEVSAENGRKNLLQLN